MGRARTATSRRMALRPISLLAAYDRQWLAPAAGCPSITIYADVDERTVATGKAYATGFAPGCRITVAHASTPKDPLFSALDAAAPGFDSGAARAAMLAAAGGNLAAPVLANRALFQQMQDVLDPGSTAFLTLHAGLFRQKHRAACRNSPARLRKDQVPPRISCWNIWKENPRPRSPGAAPGETRSQLCWRCTPLAYSITARPAIIATATASALARRILAGLTTGAAIQILVGHDTNIAELGGLLNLHWSPARLPAG